MAGTVDIREGVTWMPAGWVVDSLLDDISAQLSSEDRQLATVLIEGKTDRNAYLDLRSLDPRRFRLLVIAAEAVFERVEREGAQAFADPAFYAGFVARFRELLAMLRADPRMAQPGPV